MTQEVRRSGRVALIGRSNVGKSTLLNAALELPLAIVSRKPQTTRDRLLGVLRHRDAEIGVLDTPGLHRPRTRLGEEMNRVAREAARDADVVVYVTALPRAPKPPLAPHPGDLELLAEVKGPPLVLVVNKIDLLQDKRQLLPLMQALGESCDPSAIVPLSALASDGIERVLDEVVPLLPEDAARYEADAVTDRPLRYFAAEYVREPILSALSEEVPHAVAVTVDKFIEEPGRELVRIAATIHVEKRGQKRIVIGDRGQMLRDIGSRARLRIEALVEKQVHLELFVRVTPDWRQRRNHLVDFGLAGGSEAAVTEIATGEPHTEAAARDAPEEDENDPACGSEEEA